MYAHIYLFLAPDGRIIVYGGTLRSDKIAILDVTKSPFQWTVPTNITYPVHLINRDHSYHTSNLYKNYMIISFGKIIGSPLLNNDPNILLLDISDKYNYTIITNTV